jgi:uncharacterized Fe-S cluster protein YjdI
MKNTVKRYSNAEVTVVWQPGKCIHSEECFHALPSVFNPEQRPWINMGAGDTETIIATVKNCPSGALSIDQLDLATEAGSSELEITVKPNGPLMIKCAVKVTAGDGESTEHNKGTALCRCGASNNKPYCDGSHRKIEFTDP